MLFAPPVVFSPNETNPPHGHSAGFLLMTMVCDSSKPKR